MPDHVVVTSVGTPHPRMWDRLTAIYGEAHAVGRATELLNHNNKQRKVPLTDSDPAWRTG